MIENIENKKESAIYYQQMGLSIIPTGRNKKPLIDSWKQYESIRPTIEEITTWWDKWPEANPALVTGKVSGVVALDLDKKHNRTSKEFQIPPTASAISGNGGEHFFFKYPLNGPVKTSSAISGYGVDSRGDGGYILLSPSENENGGKYTWIVPFESKEDLAVMPDWLLSLTTEKENTKKWLDGMNGVSEGSRNDTATSMAGKIISSTSPELLESIGWDQFKIWNDRNIPPLPEKELRNVWESIKRKHVNKEKTNFDEHQFVSLGDLLNEPEETISWVIEDMLPAGGFSIMVAKPKVGKSTFVRQLALCVARGESFLERKTEKGGVLYVALEEKRGEVKNHFKLLGADGTEDLGVYVGSAPGEAYTWLENEVKKKHPILIIIDTLFRFARVADVSDYAKVTNALDPLLKLARENSTHLMCLHHARKMPGDGADATLGSTAIFGTVDTAMLLKRNKDGKRTLETQQRYGRDMEETVLMFNVDLKTITLGSLKEEEDEKKIEELIIDLLKSSKEPIDEKTIRDEIEGKTTLKSIALRSLFQGGKITRTGLGRKGDPYLYSCSLVPDICEEQENKKEIGPKDIQLKDNLENFTL